MLPIGLAVLLGGYTLTYFGFESLRGPGVGLLDLIVPGRYQGNATPQGVQMPQPAQPPMPSAAQIANAEAHPIVLPSRQPGTKY